MNRTRIICVAASVLSPVAALLVWITFEPWLGYHGACSVFIVPVVLGSWFGGLSGGAAALSLSIGLAALYIPHTTADRSALPLLVLSSIPTILFSNALLRVRRQVDRQSVRMDETLRERDRLVTTLVHELRSPLGSISNAMHLIRALSDKGSDISRPHEIAVKSIQQMSRLIDDLMDMSRLARGRVPLRYQPFDLAEVFTTVTPALEAVAAAKGVSLDVVIPAPVRVFADPTRLSQVFANLIGNAVKFTDHGTVRVTLTEQGTNAYVVIEDTGIGIAPEVLPHIFDPFRQGCLSDIRGGLGLGLSVVKGLVELHGGTVCAQSEGVGKGSRFTVELPLEETLVLRKGEKDAGLSDRRDGGGGGHGD